MHTLCLILHSALFHLYKWNVICWENILYFPSSCSVIFFFCCTLFIFIFILTIFTFAHSYSSCEWKTSIVKKKRPSNQPNDRQSNAYRCNENRYVNLFLSDVQFGHFTLCYELHFVVSLKLWKFLTSKFVFENLRYMLDLMRAHLKSTIFFSLFFSVCVCESNLNCGFTLNF